MIKYYIKTYHRTMDNSWGEVRNYTDYTRGQWESNEDVINYMKSVRKEYGIVKWEIYRLELIDEKEVA